jgi:hypothetical protein
MSDDAEAGRPMLSITAAAEATGVRRRDIRRLLDAGQFPNAYTVSGAQRRSKWNIPVTDLLAAGLRLHTPTPDNNAASNGDRGRFDRFRQESIEERFRSVETDEAEESAALQAHAHQTAALKDAQRELDRLCRELADERTRREAAEAVADERSRALEAAAAERSTGLEPHPDQITELEDARRELERLRQELAKERTHRRLAEAVAADRASALVNYEGAAADQARALESAQSTIDALQALAAEPGTTPPTDGKHTAPTAQRRWWIR